MIYVVGTFVPGRQRQREESTDGLNCCSLERNLHSQLVLVGGRIIGNNETCPHHNQQRQGGNATACGAGLQ